MTDLVTIVRGTSPDALAGLGPFGLAFIDGDHDAAAVTADVEAARKLLASGGVLACHDSEKTAAAPASGRRSTRLFPDGPSEHVDTLAIYRELA